MFKLQAFLFLILLTYTSRMCQTKRISGTPVIKVTKDILATIFATVKSANIDGIKTQTRIKEVMAELRQNATETQERINTIVNDALAIYQEKIDNLGINNIDDEANDCTMSNHFVKSAASKILTDANFCVSNTLKSIEKELNYTYSSIEFILARIHSDNELAKLCVTEYDKTEMALPNAIATGLCVTQAKDRIMLAIEGELSSLNNATVINDLSIDTLNRIKSCDDDNDVSSFVADTEFIYDKITTCISNLQSVKTIR